MRKGRKILIVVSCFVVLFFVGVFWYFWSTLVSTETTNAMMMPDAGIQKPILHDTPIIETPEVKRTDILTSPKGKIFILGLGIDARGDHLTGRSDAMVVMSLDKDKDQMHLVSIPRDAYVSIAGSGKYDKINHAYAYGGVNAARGTVEDLLGIKIDHFVVFNFSSFVSLIDALGGVEIDVPFSFSEQDSKDNQGAIRLNKGLQILDGEQALAYARMRKSDPRGDIGRGERQQEVAKALFDKLLSFSSVPKLTSIHNSIKGTMATDVELFDLPGLLPYLSSFSSVEMHTMSGEGSFIDGVYYYKLNEDSVSEVRSILK